MTEVPMGRVRTSVCLSVRVTPEESAKLEAWCDRREVTISDALRRCVQAVIDGEPDPSPAIARVGDTVLVAV